MIDIKTAESRPRKIVAGLDIGTSKIGVVVGEADQSGRIQILGAGMSPSEGLRQGVVINLDLAVKSIERAVQEAQLTAGVQISEVIVGIAGDHVRSVNSRGVVAVAGENREINALDVERVIDAAKAIALPIDREVLDVLPQEYIVDNQGGIKNPVGITGVRLEAEVHLITGAITTSQNIIRCVNKAGLRVTGRVLESLAASYVALDDTERELGVVLLDLGGGTTDMALFHEGSIRNTAVIGLGGQNVTNDIALGLRTPVNQAEEIKKKYGNAMVENVSQNEILMAPGIGGRSPKEVTRDVLAQIIQARMEEIFSLAAKEIKRSGYGDVLGAGVVLTGGGSLLEGCADLAESVFDMPVKIGIPNVTGLTQSACNPVFAAGAGLVYHGLFRQDKLEKKVETKKNMILENILTSFVNFVKDFFKR